MRVNLSFFNDKIKTIAVALSGGKDSMALLHYLCNAKAFSSAKIIAINVEHGIRGESSLADSAFVKDYCNKNNIPLLCYSVNSPCYAKQNKLSLEQAARALRYDCFYDALNANKCDVVVTAHHQKDNAESVLFNLFRGTGLKGASGINYQVNKIVRPFLQTPKAEIDEYVKDNAIPFVTDQTNQDTTYKRNYIRAEILPLIEKGFDDGLANITRFAETAKEEDEFLNGLADNLIIRERGLIKISVSSPATLFRRATIITLKELGITHDYTKSHAEDALSLCQRENGARIDLPKNVTAYKEYDHIVFCIKQQPQCDFVKIVGQDFNFGGYSFKIINAQGVDLKNGIYVSLEKTLGCIVRYKKEGDVIQKFGGGSKSLGDFLTDKKIPLRERALLPVIAQDNQIMAVAGVAISNNAKADQSTKKLIQIIKE